METREDSMESQGEIRPPIMLLALNATDTVEWEELHNKVCGSDSVDVKAINIFFSVGNSISCTFG